MSWLLHTKNDPLPTHSIAGDSVSKNRGTATITELFAPIETRIVAHRNIYAAFEVDSWSQNIYSKSRYRYNEFNVLLVLYITQYMYCYVINSRYVLLFYYVGTR